MLFSAIQTFFAPPPPIPQLSDEQVRTLYPRFRWQIMESTFIGYGTYYLLRNNIGTVAKEMFYCPHLWKNHVSIFNA